MFRPKDLRRLMATADLSSVPQAQHSRPMKQMLEELRSGRLSLAGVASFVHFIDKKGPG